MIELTRTIRFCAGHPDPGASPEHRNGYGGAPPLAGLGAFYSLDVTCSGEPDPVTGYLVNIKDIDRASLRTIVETISRAFVDRPSTDAISLLAESCAALSAALEPELARVRWHLTPTFSLEHDMSAPTLAVIRQKFDFAASHRLHTTALSDDENRRIFGKCNNPSGHGHNYQVEPAVAVRCGDQEQAFGLADLERLCATLVIDRFDHTNLNVDTDEFGPDGLLPSVENIARVIHGILEPAIADAGATLKHVTVWETDRTSCVYPA